MSTLTRAQLIGILMKSVLCKKPCWSKGGCSALLALETIDFRLSPLWFALEKQGDSFNPSPRFGMLWRHTHHFDLDIEKSALCLFNVGRK